MCKIMKVYVYAPMYNCILTFAFICMWWDAQCVCMRVCKYINVCLCVYARIRVFVWCMHARARARVSVNMSV